MLNREPRFDSERGRLENAFVFLDETGRLPVLRDRFFGVGMLKCPEPAVIQRPIQTLRDREQFRAEIKWSEVRQGNIRIYRQALKCFFDCEESTFACFIADKKANNPLNRFGDQWKAYERLSAQLLVGNIKPSEQVTVLADEYSTPAGITFEENIRDAVHLKLQRQAIVGVCRMRSTGVDLFQVLDLILGAVSYDHKIAAGLIHGRNPKGRLLNHIKDRLGVDTFVGGVKTPRVNVKQFGRRASDLKSAAA